MNGGSWQPDPTQRHELRWWDGSEWTPNVSDHGIAGLDPLPAPVGTPSSAPPPMPTPTGPPPMAPAPAWGAPSAPLGATSMVPLASVPPPTPAPGARRRNVLIASAVAAVIALGIAGVLVLGGDDDSPGTVAAPSTSTTTALTTTVAAPTTVPATTLAPTTVPSTLPPTTAAATTVAPPTTIAGAGVDVLLAAMPAGDDVPASWTQYSESRTDLQPQSGPGYGFCGGDDGVTRAQAAGATAIIDGPTWDIEGGGWFGINAQAFPTEEAAIAFMTSTELAANSCMTDPVQYDVTEADLDLFDESVADDFVWHIAEGSGAFPEATTDASQLTRTVADEYVSGTLDGTDYSTTLSYLSRYERHGRVVLVFWLWGNWGESGWSSPNPYAFQPTDEAVDADAATVRLQIIQRLTAAGAL